MSLRHHFVRGPGLFRLIVIVQLPRQVRDGKQDEHQGSERPECLPIFQERVAHVDLSDFSENSFGGAFTCARFPELCRNLVEFGDHLFAHS